MGESAGVRKWIIKNLAAIVVISALLFWAAGRVDWIWGWSFVAVLDGNLFATMVVLLPRRPDLLAERSGLRPGTKKWDLVLAPLTAHGTWLTAIVAALDLRFGWSAGFELSGHLSGLVLVTGSCVTVLWAMLSNRFFAATVRIQTERGHTVATAGPYRFVRHPGYGGTLLFYAGIPALLGSAWAYLASAAGLTALVLRTLLEDITLRSELPGYQYYAARVRYRLIPGLW
jgi:protein-S-isoprenylcysteine O-methyltransferase Ste14